MNFADEVTNVVTNVVTDVVDADASAAANAANVIADASAVADVRHAVKVGEIKPVKSLGQNFLMDSGVAERIVAVADLCERDLVLEIGAGAAALTRRLCRSAGHVVAVEIDRRLISFLNSKTSENKNLTIINDDILKLDILRVLKTSRLIDAYPNLKIISNLPYCITTPIIMKILEGELKPSKMVFMMQKEVADRIVARPSTKEYGALTVSVNYYTKPSKAFNVSPHCFVPQPDVESTVLVFDPHEETPVDLTDKQFFFKVVRAAFAQRRKQLVNCLIHAGLLPNDKELAYKMFSGIGLNTKTRGEDLSIHEFARLSNAVYNEVNEKLQ